MKTDALSRPLHSPPRLSRDDAVRVAESIPVSTVELSEPLPTGVFHLLTADNEVASRYGGYIALCGVVMAASGLPPSCYSPRCECNRDPWYCPVCVREAVRFSAEADDRKPGYPMKHQIPPHAGSGGAAPLPVAGRIPSGPEAQDDDCQPWGYFVGECGHPVFGGPAWYVGPCRSCAPTNE